MEQRTENLELESVVRGHADWVYACARRRVGEAGLAEDVAQAVFVLYWRKRPRLEGEGRLAGWLYAAVRYCAANAMRLKKIRERHEREAAMSRREALSEAMWDEVSAGLEQAMDRLREGDRQALLLRFYRKMSFAEVGRVLGMGEDGARKRVERAVEKLRGVLARQGVGGTSAGLMVLLGEHVVGEAPRGVVEAMLAGGGKAGGVIAKGAGWLMVAAKVKVAAMVLVGAGVAGGVGYEVVKQSAGDGKRVMTAMIVPVKAEVAAEPAEEVEPPVEMVDFDGLYEKAPGSRPDLSRQVGPNTFRVTTVARFGADGKAVVADGRGKSVAAATLPMEKIGGGTAGKDVMVVFLEPGVEQYDIDRLRVFNHYTRRSLPDLVVTPVQGVSALRIEAPVGTMPRRIDLWLDVASYGPGNTAVKLPPTKGSTVQIGAVAFGIDDIRDGSSIMSGRETTVVINPKRSAGRYQIQAVLLDGRKYLSNFLLSQPWQTQSIQRFPFGLKQIDHFELRPLAHEPPFYFDGIRLPKVTLPSAEMAKIPPIVVVKAERGKSQATLPCGAVVELSGISYHPSAGKTWWGVDGKRVPTPRVAGGISVGAEHTRLREFVGRVAQWPTHRPADSWLLWRVPGGSAQTEGHIAALLPEKGPVALGLGVGATDWQVVEEIGVEELPAEVKCGPGRIEAPEEDEKGVAIWMTGAKPANMRIVLQDWAGNDHVVRSMSSYSMEKLPPWGIQTARLVWDVKPEDVCAIRLEARREEYAEFEDVPMEAK